ncbi:MAG TPA: hypothetical protein VF752_11085 [Thermoleophilaceae bacterium]
MERNFMQSEVHRQHELMDRSGLGLLPGIAIAFAIVLAIMAALVIQEWWVTFAVLGALFAVTGAVVWVILKLLGDED